MNEAFYQMYLEELEAITPFGQDEETGLLKALLAGDTGARSRLIEGNLKKALEIAKEYENTGILMNDLVQEANMALTVAAGSFQQGDFNHYLEAKIRKALEAYAQEEKQEEQTEEEITARVNVLKDISKMMAEELGREATVSELADKMKMAEEEIKSIMKITLAAMNTREE